MSSDAATHRLADAVARRSYGKLVAFLAARTRDVAAAEDALAEAFATALTDWPNNGCPTNPEAWLLTVARRKLIDAARRRQSAANAAIELRVLADGNDAPSIDADIPDQLPDHLPDNRLALMFACAHPAIDAGIRAPLILQCVLGLDAASIASAFLMSPAAMGQRLVRAKHKIRDAAIALRVPEREELPDRLGTVLDTIYAAFAEGWSAPDGTDMARHDLAEEALFLGRLVAGLLPDEPEALGLLALMLHAQARLAARRNANGDYVPLAEQDAALWEVQMIEEAETLLLRASALGAIGRYQLEGALQSAHVERRRSGCANWPAVVRLYDALLALSGSPVVAINRALALAHVEGCAAALVAIDELADEPRLQTYQPYWAARAQLLANTGAHDAAHEAYDVAIGLERDPAVRRFLRDRQTSLRTS